MKRDDILKLLIGFHDDIVQGVQHDIDNLVNLLADKSESDVNAYVTQPESQVSETKAIQKNDDSYHLSCQNCGTTSKPLQMIPFRNDDNVVGLLMACDDCKDTLYGERFDRESKFSHPAPKQSEHGISEERMGEMAKCYIKGVKGIPFGEDVNAIEDFKSGIEACLTELGITK